MIAGPECTAGARRTAEGGYRHRSAPCHEHQQQCQQQANIRSDFLPRRSSSRGVRCRPATAPPHFVARRIALTEPATPGKSFRDASTDVPRPCAASATGGRRQASKPLGVPGRGPLRSRKCSKKRSSAPRPEHAGNRPCDSKVTTRHRQQPVLMEISGEPRKIPGGVPTQSAVACQELAAACTLESHAPAAEPAPLRRPPKRP